jgi:large subunit GTPase 1
VQIVDARNPLMFRSEDLETYVKDVDRTKQNLLLVNKADMMTTKQRRAWARYFKSKKIAYRFFSAHLAKELIEAQELEEQAERAPAVAGPSSKPASKPPAHEDQDEEDFDDMSDDDDDEGSEEDEESDEDEEEDSDDDAPLRAGLEPDSDEDTRILTVEELEDIFLAHAPAPDPDGMFAFDEHHVQKR